VVYLKATGGSTIASASAPLYDTAGHWVGILTVPPSAAAGTNFVTATCFDAVGFETQNYAFVPFSVVAAVSSTQLSSTANPAIYGQPVTFTATITSTAGSGTPTGAVTFTDGSAALGSAALASGTATLTTSTLTVGGHTISAAYAGDPSHTGSSASLTQTVNRAPTKLGAAPASKTTQQFSATLTRADNGGPIAGQTIVFSTRSPLAGAQDTVCSAVTGPNGTATCTGTIPLLDKVLDSSYRATYGGSPNYLGGTAAGTLT
jgi:hypothetical protein